MQNTNILDLIVYLVRRIQIGDELRDVELEGLQGYQKSEISAAYSWVLQKYQSGDLDEAIKSSQNADQKTPPRILHFAERVVISKEAYGYLLELYHLGLINFETMEKVIEQAMLNSAERVSIDRAKQMLTEIMFDQPSHGSAQHSGVYLKGNESIN